MEVKVPCAQYDTQVFILRGLGANFSNHIVTRFFAVDPDGCGGSAEDSDADGNAGLPALHTHREQNISITVVISPKTSTEIFPCGFRRRALVSKEDAEDQL